MSFRKDVPNYKSLQSDEFYLNSAPDAIWDKLEAYCTKVCETSSQLKSIVNGLNEIVLVPSTQNWGYDWLIGDLSKTIGAIRGQVIKGKFYLLMDAIALIADYGEIEEDEINEFLEDQAIGYVLHRDTWDRTIYWEMRVSIDDIAQKIEETKAVVKSEFQQAFEHFEQAKRQLENAGSERARKDAVRDCASAMEMIVKALGQENDIKEASKKLRKQSIWGKDEIVKDGDAIFNTLHRLYPDLRHGSTETSQMTLEEARYWVERITTYINYMIGQQKTLGLTVKNEQPLH